MKLFVECYSGAKADERPLRFQWDGRRYTVEETLDQWHEPNATYFKLRADDGNTYILRLDNATPEGVWTLSSFRAKPS
jgi:uncharacterized protein (UPF0128 family)